MSVFSSVVLVIMRSINILQPFAIVKLTWIKVSMVFYLVIWILLSAYDEVWITRMGYCARPIALFKHLVYKPMAGSRFITDIGHGSLTYSTTILAGMTFLFIIPSIIVFICFGLQIHSLYGKTVRASFGKNLHRRPALTILLLTSLFLMCNLPSIEVYIYYNSHKNNCQKI